MEGTYGLSHSHIYTSRDVLPCPASARLLQGDLLGSAVWGCVAASFMAEELGVPKVPIARLQVGDPLG